MEATSTSSVFEIILLLFGLYDMIAGIVGLFTGKIYTGGKKLTETYTEESLQKYAFPYNISNILLGLAIVLLEGWSIARNKQLAFVANIPTVVLYIVIGVLLVAAIIILIAIRKILVKKETNQ